jgi:hypothetical protein
VFCVARKRRGQGFIGAVAPPSIGRGTPTTQTIGGRGEGRGEAAGGADVVLEPMHFSGETYEPIHSREGDKRDGRRMRHHARGTILLLVLLYLGICVLIPLNIWERGEKGRRVTNHWHYCCWFDTLLGARG